MPKNIIKRFLPHHSKIREHKHLRHLGERLHDPNLWHLNRHSVSSAVAVGLFVSYMPVPLQMLVAAFFSIWFRTNLPIATITVWISNPITIPPMFYFAYQVGAALLGRPEKEVTFELSFEWLTHGLVTIWQPLLLGSFLLGSLFAVIGYFSMQLAWRMMVVRKWKHRAKVRQKNKARL